MSSTDRISINKDISLARTMPSKFYLEDFYFENTLNTIFKNSWHFVAHKNSINRKISPFTLLKDTISQPIIISKAGGQINFLSN